MTGKFHSSCPRGVHEFSGPTCDHCGIPYGSPPTVKYAQYLEYGYGGKDMPKRPFLTGRDAKIILRAGGEEITTTGSWDFSTLDAAIESAKPGDTINVLPNGGNEMNINQALDHTRMRFNTMTERQLWNRMGKMSVLVKLEAFAIVADERGFPDLAVAARARLTRMTSGGKIGVAGNPITAIRKSGSTLRKSDSGRMLRRIDG